MPPGFNPDHQYPCPKWTSEVQLDTSFMEAVTLMEIRLWEWLALGCRIKINGKRYIKGFPEYKEHPILRSQRLEQQYRNNRALIRKMFRDAINEGYLNLEVSSVNVQDKNTVGGIWRVVAAALIVHHRFVTASGFW